MATMFFSEFHLWRAMYPKIYYYNFTVFFLKYFHGITIVEQQQHKQTLFCARPFADQDISLKASQSLEMQNKSKENFRE